MAHIKISRGLDIPIKGKPQGEVKKIIGGGEVSMKSPKHVALNLDPFEGIRFKLLAKKGDGVKKGQPLLEDKATKGRLFVSPASGVITEVRRGLKRRLLDIVIQIDKNEDDYEHEPLNFEKASKEEIIERLMTGGAFAHIRTRPFNLLANPNKLPRTIFVKAIESAPYIPPAELQVKGHEEDFQTGLNVLTKISQGPVHLVHRKDTSCEAFYAAENVFLHSAEGPHPIANQSVHIHHIDPITSHDNIIWTLNVVDVITIGHLMTNGKYYTDRVVSIAGPGVIEEHVGYYNGRMGYPIHGLISGKINKEPNRFISGDPLMGQKVSDQDFLGFNHTAFSVIPENTHRQMFHFFRLGPDKYTFSKTYLSGHFDNKKRTYDFTTSQHGEHRAFVESSLYNKVMPLDVSTIHLVKAIMAEDYDLAEELGLLEVDAEDFALPTFVDPSKIVMTDIVKQGLENHAKELLD